MQGPLFLDPSLRDLVGASEWWYWLAFELIALVNWKKSILGSSDAEMRCTFHRLNSSRAETLTDPCLKVLQPETNFQLGGLKKESKRLLFGSTPQPPKVKASSLYVNQFLITFLLNCEATKIGAECCLVACCWGNQIEFGLLKWKPSFQSCLTYFTLNRTKLGWLWYTKGKEKL